MTKTKARCVRQPRTPREFAAWVTGDWEGATACKRQYRYCQAKQESLASIARDLAGQPGPTPEDPAYAKRITWRKIALLNFGTANPAEINWYLENFNGCGRRVTTDGKNYIFQAEDDQPWLWIPTAAEVSGPSGGPIEGALPEDDLPGSLRVTVFDGETHEPVADVRVEVRIDEETAECFGLTDSSGEIFFESVPVGGYTVHAEGDERSGGADVVIEGGETTEIEIVLEAMQLVATQWVQYTNEMHLEYMFKRITRHQRTTVREDYALIPKDHVLLKVAEDELYRDVKWNADLVYVRRGRGTFGPPDAMYRAKQFIKWARIVIAIKEGDSLDQSSDEIFGSWESLEEKRPTSFLLQFKP